MPLPSVLVGSHTSPSRVLPSEEGCFVRYRNPLTSSVGEPVAVTAAHRASPHPTLSAGGVRCPHKTCRSQGPPRASKLQHGCNGRFGRRGHLAPKPANPPPEQGI